jgi:hypothetical protein
MFAFGVLFWMFVLLPNWIQPDAEAIEVEEDMTWRNH